MKTTNKVEILPQEGVYIGIPAPEKSANLLSNWKYDAKTRAWNNQLGYEKFFSNQTQLNPFMGALQREVDSVYAFSQHNGAKQSYLYETNGTLYVLDPTNETIIQLKTGRQIPSPTQPHTSYAPFGKYCIITNGLDGPLKYRGSTSGDRLFDLGWRQRPGTPTVTSIADPDEVPVTFLDATSIIVSDNVWEGNDQTFIGITPATKDDVCRYRYIVTWVNESGSESPISQASNEVKFTAIEITRGADTGVPRSGAILQIPTGPIGTVARRIYRTKSDGANAFFFLRQLNNNSDTSITDFADDGALGSAAPLASDSVLMPAPACRFSATFKNCLFVDGGEMDPTRLYYSQPLQPDTFAQDNYFEIGTREGGDITGLAPYYNSLIIFRENAIDLIRGDALNGFVLVPYIQGVGSLSPHSVTFIPNLGLSFMSHDGIYLIRGGLDGGADLTLNKISDGIQEFFDRASHDKLPAAIGAYSSAERELHFYFSIDGVPFLNKGLVYHIDNTTWSERDGFPVKCITVDHDGNFICGFDKNNVYSGISPTPSNNTPAYGGLFVISGLRRNGYVWANDEVKQQDDPMLSSFRSSWHDLGLPFQKKYIKYVYLYVLTKGDITINLKAYKDRSWDSTLSTDGGTAKMQRADHADQPVYDKAIWDTARWQDKLLTQVRFDIGQMAASEFAFSFNTTTPCEFIGYSIEYNENNTQTIQGKK